MVEGDTHMKNKPINLVRLFALLHVVVGGVLSLMSYMTLGADEVYSVIEYLIYNYSFFIIAQILFLIYIFAFFNKKPNNLLLPISYIFYVCHLGLIFIRNIVPNFKIHLETHNVLALFRFAFIDVLGEHLVPIAFFAFLIIVCFKKFKLMPTARKLVIIYSAISIVTVLLFIPKLYELYENYQRIINEYHVGYIDVDSIYKSQIFSCLANITVIFNIIATFILWKFALPKKIKENAE